MAIALSASRPLNEFPSSRRPISSFILATPLKATEARVAAMMTAEQLQDENLRRVGDYAALNLRSLLGLTGTESGIFLPIYQTHSELSENGQRSSFLINFRQDQEGEMSLGRVKVMGLLKGHPNPLGPYRTPATNKNLIRRSRDWGLDYDN